MDAMTTSPAAQPDSQGPAPSSVVTAPTNAPLQPQTVQPNQISPNAVTPGGPQFQNMRQAPVSDQTQQFNQGEQAEQIKPTRWDKWAAGWDQLSHEMPVGLPGADEVGALPRWWMSQGIKDYSDNNGGPMMSADQANKMYPGRPEQYTAPVSQMVAQMEYNDRQRQEKIAQWKNAGSATPMTDTMQSFFGGFADPLNLALSVTAGPLIGRMAPEAATAVGRFATRFGENFAINAATGAITYGVEKQEGANPSAGGAVRQAAEGALGGTLFGYATDALAQGLRGAWESFRRESPDTQARITKQVVASIDKNTTPTLEAQREVLEQRNAGAIQDGQNVRRITPTVETPTQFYAAADHSGRKAVFNDGLGPGTQLTSSSDVANNRVSNPEGSIPGKIGETSIPKDAKLLDVDKSAGADYIQKDQESFLKAVEEKTGMPISDLVKNDQTIQDVIKNLGEWAGHDGVPTDILNQIQDVAKEQGYTGYSLLRKDASGTATDHLAHMFDENHPITGQEYMANANVTPKISSDSATPGPQATQNPPGSEFSTPEVDKEVHDLKHGPVLNTESEYMDPFVKDIYDQAHQELTKLAETSPTAKEALKELQRMAANDKQRSAMAKALSDCVSGGMS